MRDSLISVIIPAFKQEKTIVRDLVGIDNSLSQIGKPFEIILVVDGRFDKTFEKASKLKLRSLRVVGYQNNRGKGYAIRYGMSKTKGNIVGFIDAGMDINPSGLLMLLNYMEWYDADVIVGSKRHPVSKIDYPQARRIISYLSQIYIKLLFGLNIRDTQVGLKFFKRAVLERVLPRLVVEDYAFDIELLVLANEFGFKRIHEAPVEINWTQGSGITSKNLWKILFLTFLDTLAIFYRLKLRGYYNYQNRKKWKYEPELSFKLDPR